MPLHTRTLLEARAMLAKGETTPTALTAACLSRIAATEPALNSCITVLAEAAMQRAAQLEAQGNPSNLPLWGIPVTVKDLLCTKDAPTTCASAMLAGFMAPYDAFVVERLREAGAIIVAKANLDEFAMGSGTENSASGPTSNPWDVQRVPGGSSGGSAAGVAAGQAFGSLGSDSGGSIRQPASLCGCVGLKPTYGYVSRYGAVAYASSFDQVGPMARTVADCAALFGVIAGYDERDATSAQLPAPDVTPALVTRSLHGKTFGVVKELWEGGLSDEVAAVCHNAVEAAKAQGAKIVELSLPHLQYAVATYYVLTSAEASTNLARFDGVRFGLRAQGEHDLVGMYTASRSQGFGEEVKRRILLGTHVLSSGYYDAYFQKAAKVRRLLLQDFQAALGQCDALIAPVSPVTAWKKGEHVNDPLTLYKMDMLTLGLNLAGLPGVSLPAGLGVTSGLPVGVQLMGRAFDDVALLGMANALEMALPRLGAPKGVPA